jgi:N-acylneuraminate cytidylyltransferase
VLAIIPARGGSRVVPRKNIREVGGKPLIAWTILAALESKLIDRAVVSSDDEEIIETARRYGADVPFVRPSELARDDSPYQDFVTHAISELPGFDYVVSLNPTSPLRSVEDVDGCISLCAERGAPACVTVTPAPKHPAWMFHVDQDGLMKPVLGEGAGPVPPRRQELPEVFVLNGSVHVAECDWFLQHQSFFSDETMAYKMPAERSVDLDSETDLKFADLLLRARTR